MSGRISLLAFNRTTGKAWLLAIACGGYALFPVMQEIRPDSYWNRFREIPSGLEAITSLSIGLLLVFRTNTAYAKWWEARTLWGALVNCSRNLVIKSRVYTGQAEEAERMSRLISGFAFALKDHLRSAANLDKIEGFEDATEDPVHVPGYVTHQVFSLIEKWHREELIDGHVLRELDREASKLLEICGSCERIRKTRISRSYRNFVNQCLFVYLITLPWGLVDDFRWMTIPTTIIAAYFVAGLELVAVAVDEPFGVDEDDLDLDGLCQTIKTSANELVHHSAPSR